jgi:hypothetical protein
MRPPVAAAIKQRQIAGAGNPRLNGRGYLIFEMHWIIEGTLVLAVLKF